MPKNGLFLDTYSIFRYRYQIIIFIVLVITHNVLYISLLLPKELL